MAGLIGRLGIALFGIGNDEGLYNMAKDCEDWFDFIVAMQDFGMNKTPDGAKWTEADYDEMSEMMAEL